VEEALEKLGYLVFLLIWLVPSLLRWLGKRRKSKGPAVELPPEPMPPPAPSPPPSIPRPQPQAPLVTPPSAPAGQFDTLLERARSARARAGDIERRCTLHRGAAGRLLTTVRSDCIEPLDALIARLERRDPSDTLAPGGIVRLQHEVVRLERLVELFDLVLAQRVDITQAQVLDLLDQAAQDCLVPYLVHARRLEVPFSANRALVVIDPAGDEQAPPLETPELAIAAIDEAALERPAMWTDIASRVALAWIRGVPGLQQRLTAELGLPDARSSSAQFAATGRLTINALISIWLPQIAADTAATIQLGPGFAAGLEQAFGAVGGREGALTCRFGRRFGEGPPPLHLRMYVACVALDRLGYEEQAAERWARWKKAVDEPEAVVLASQRHPAITVPLDRTYGLVAGIVEAVIGSPMPILGGYPLGQIPDLAADARAAARTAEAAERLASGSPVGDSPRTVLGAAALAVESSAQAELRIRKAALESLGGEADILPASARVRSGRAGPGDLPSLLRSPGFVARAFAISAAFAPTRGGRRPR
jgi:hypothetical protein